MRRLTLRRETLTELTGRQLVAVVGGTHVGCGITADCTHLSVDACPTVPIGNCVRTVAAGCATVGNINTCIATG
ncbi:MAG TPA: hypothetical protein VFQ85_07060 [Mycobacteriales bacterium]|jgi:hypothetical protein|nr:hypothetical protein [Mycobacteriales bacterium]